MKIGIGSDHGGYQLKQALISHYASKNVKLIDYGTDSEESCDYPDIAEGVCNDMLNGKLDLAILICGAGIGMSIAANRHKGIRGAILYSDYVAKMAKEHNNANVVIFGGRTMSLEEAARRFDIFMETKYEGGRHKIRLDKLDR
ncbi:MAG: ribose 5-phosphate isomerase B [Lactobacillus sp.]|jgi:ribose 5-phosphate isomerase B|nr:ribose 5-phosphate isomerase B [Lactobacillus sp.]